MKKELRQLAVKLRSENKLSYSEIKRRLGISKSTLSYWLKDMPLTESKIRELQREGWKKGEASRERYRNRMKEKRSFKENEVYNKYLEQFKNISDDALFIAGLMLYLGEGDKKVNSRVVIANTDPEIINFFMKWAIKYLDVKKEEIRIQLHLYEDMALEKEMILWQNRLKLPKEQFYKSSIRKLQRNSFSYKDSIRHGTCSLYIFGVDKKRELSMAIKAFIDNYLV